MTKVLRFAGRFAFAAAILFSLFLPVMPAEAHGPGIHPAGEVFTDPSHVVPMPPEWLKQPVSHEPWAHRADIAVSLEKDVYQMLIPLIDKYARENRLKIEVTDGTCGIASGHLSRKAVDIGGFCCPAGGEDRLPGLRFHTVGIVSKAFFVHPGNPIEGLTAKQITNIYRGKTRRWSELQKPDGTPGPNLSIRAIARLHCKLRPGHWRLMLDQDAHFGPSTNEVGSMSDMIAQVGAHKDALGWEALGVVEHFKSLGSVKIVKLDGIDPRDAEALAAHRYPFYRVYNITTWEDANARNPKAQKLVEYLLKEAEHIDPARFGFASPAKLKKAGWQFSGDELVGEPAKARHIK